MGKYPCRGGERKGNPWKFSSIKQEEKVKLGNKDRDII